MRSHQYFSKKLDSFDFGTSSPAAPHASSQSPSTHTAFPKQKKTFSSESSVSFLNDNIPAALPGDGRETTQNLNERNAVLIEKQHTSLLLPQHSTENLHMEKTQKKDLSKESYGGSQLPIFGSFAKEGENDPVFYKINKKKYKLNSFLFNILCQFSKSRLSSFLGHEILFRYFTIPYRLSLSRFIGNKVLRSYYKNLDKSGLLRLHKKLSIKAKRSYGDNVKKEIAKNLILNLEGRLAPSLLRLLQFKPLYTKKYLKRDMTQKDKSLSWRKIKSPWKNFSILQIKQQINHGKIYLNGKKVKSPSLRLKLYDQITIGGFVPNPQWKSFTESKQVACNSTLPLVDDFFMTTRTNLPFEKKQLFQTVFFRNPEQFLSDLTSLKANLSMLESDNSNNSIFNKFFSVSFSSSFSGGVETATSLGDNTSNFKDLLCNFNAYYIKNLKIKRFSEIFYLTYRNFFLLSDCSIFSKHSFSNSPVERFNNLKFFFQAIGFNQSIYFLWPLISMLSIQPWNSELKNNIIHTALSAKNEVGSFRENKDKSFNLSLMQNTQKNLKDLLGLKNLQTKLAISLLKQNSKTNKLTEAPLSKIIDTSQNKILNNPIFSNKPNFSWLFNRSSLDNCYASVVYGTRKCKWVQLQQQKKGGFYNKIYNKINFFELELDFFQLAYRHYKSH